MSRNVKKNLIPNFNVPDGFTSKTYLEKIVWDGFENLCKKAESVGKSEVDISKLEEYFEKDVFDLISNVNSYNIFLIQSDGMIDFLKKINAEKFEDLVLGFAI